MSAPSVGEPLQLPEDAALYVCADCGRLLTCHESTEPDECPCCAWGQTFHALELAGEPDAAQLDRMDTIPVKRLVD